MPSADGIRYSFVVPIYGDGELAEEFCAAFGQALQGHLGETPLEGAVELIFVNDGSPNDSFAHLEALASAHPWVRAIDLSRNFGQHIAISCGYANARGEYVGMLNVDQEDPPDQIPLLLNLIEKGDHDIVVGLREGSQPITSTLFHWGLNRLTGQDGPLNEATLRVMNRAFVDAYNGLTERSRYVPGLERWLGFRRGHLPVRHRERTRGRSSYSFGRRLRMALDSIVSFSDLPLKLAAGIGFSVAGLGLVALLALVVLKLKLVEFQAGWPSTIATIVFVGGVQTGVIGMASIYIGRVLREVQARPLYVVRRRVNEPAVSSGRPTPGAAPAES